MRLRTGLPLRKTSSTPNLLAHSERPRSFFFVERNSNIHRCQEVTIFERGKKYWSKRVACKNKSCSHVWCRECHHATSRWGLHSCDGKAELKRLAREQGWQRCPGCKIPIQKNLGCNHMMCSAPGCRTYVSFSLHFCTKADVYRYAAGFVTDAEQRANSVYAIASSTCVPSTTTSALG